MLSKNQSKLIKSLHNKKDRYANKLFIVEGEKLVTEILHSTFKVQSVFGLKDTINLLEQHYKDTTYQEISEEELIKVSQLKTPNKVLALVEMPENKLDIFALKEELTIVLDTIKDPGNLGTIIRIADWFGIKNIICSENTVDVYNSKVVQATMGSITRVKVHYHGLKSVLETFQSMQIPCYGALLEGENIYQKKLLPTGLILIGNESVGISKDLEQYISDKITIPSFEVDNGQEAFKTAESLNAAVATSIICAEFFRQKNYSELKKG